MTINAPKRKERLEPWAKFPKSHWTTCKSNPILLRRLVIAVALDNQPLATSSRILLQVMSEEKNNGFQTVEQGDITKMISIGQNPWLVKEIEGTVCFKRADAAAFKVTVLNGNGDSIKAVGHAAEIELLPDVLYYLIGKVKNSPPPYSSPNCMYRSCYGLEGLAPSPTIP